MNKVKHLALQKPIIFSVALVFSSIGVLYLTTLASIESEFNQDLLRSTIKSLILLGLTYLIIRLKWLDHTFLSTPISAWQPKWWLASLPMALVATINLLSIEWPKLEYNSISFLGWIYSNLATSLFEEILLRGLCFFILFQAWKQHSNGLIKAALCQAAIFGGAHFVNILEMPTVAVIAQVIFATLIGIGFAGLVTFSRSIWPAIIIHFIINSAGSANSYFQPGFVQSELSVTSYAVMITVILVICALPGYFLLRSTQKRINA